MLRVRMTLNEVEQEEFQKLLNEYIKKHGTEPLEDMFHFWRKFRKATCGTVPVFPISEIFHYVLFMELQKDEYKSLTAHQKAQALKEKKGIAVSTIYAFFKKYYPKINKALKQNTFNRS